MKKGSAKNREKYHRTVENWTARIGLLHANEILLYCGIITSKEYDDNRKRINRRVPYKDWDGILEKLTTVERIHIRSIVGTR